MKTKLCRTMRGLPGFTLVEVMVVLVVLGVLSAFSVPAVTGYIDSSKVKQVVSEAQSCVATATQLAAAKYAQQEIVPTSSGNTGTVTTELTEWVGTDGIATAAPTVDGETALTEGTGKYIIPSSEPETSHSAQDSALTLIKSTANVPGTVTAYQCSSSGETLYLVYQNGGTTVVYCNSASSAAAVTGIEVPSIPTPVPTATTAPPSSGGTGGGTAATASPTPTPTATPTIEEEKKDDGTVTDVTVTIPFDSFTITGATTWQHKTTSEKSGNLTFNKSEIYMYTPNWDSDTTKITGPYTYYVMLETVEPSDSYYYQSKTIVPEPESSDFWTELSDDIVKLTGTVYNSSSLNNTVLKVGDIYIHTYTPGGNPKTEYAIYIGTSNTYQISNIPRRNNSLDGSDWKVIDNKKIKLN